MALCGGSMVPGYVQGGTRPPPDAFGGAVVFATLMDSGGPGLGAGSGAPAKERRIRFAARFAPQQEPQFASVVVPPHRTLPIRSFLAGCDIIPAVRPMIDRVQQQTLMLGIRGEIRFVEEGIGHRQ